MSQTAIPILGNRYSNNYKDHKDPGLFTCYTLLFGNITLNGATPTPPLHSQYS